jgi:hypothetical protein
MSALGLATSRHHLPSKIDYINAATSIHDLICYALVMLLSFRSPSSFLLSSSLVGSEQFVEGVSPSSPLISLTLFLPRDRSNTT